MNIRWALRVLLLSLAFAGSTVIIGWWGTAVLGLAWGVIGRATQKPALTAGVAAAAGWVILLGWSAASGPVALLADKLGGIASMPGSVFLGLTILLPFLLGFTAARIVRRQGT